MAFSDAMIAILEQDAGSNVHHCMPRSAKLPNLSFFCQAGHNEPQIRKVQIKITMFNSFAILWSISICGPVSSDFYDLVLT